MTILTLANAYGPRTGGIRTQIDQLRRCYAAAGHHPVLVAPAAADGDEADASGPIHWRRAPRLPINPDYRNLWALRPLLRLAEQIGPDSVEIVDKWTLPRLAKPLRAAGLPVIGFSCERLDQVLRPYLGAGALTRAAIGRYNAWFARQFDRVVCHSAFAAAELPGPAEVVPLGVDVTQFGPERRDEALRRELLGDGRVLLLYVGRLVREKQVGLLAAMMSELAGRGARLVVAGSGPEAARLAAAPGVRLLGFTRQTERLAALYASCDLFVHPSPIESFGLGVLEALASGCRVVGASGGAVAEVLPPAFPRARPQAAAWVAAVEQALAIDPVAAARAARAAAGRYPWERCADRLLAIHGNKGVRSEWRFHSPSPDQLTP
jgi:alpha-1,6-mannosyltransferase